MMVNLGLMKVEIMKIDSYKEGKFYINDRQAV